MALLQDHESPFEMCWAFSIYLEAVAILPQLFLLQKLGEARARQLRQAVAGIEHAFEKYFVRSFERHEAGSSR